MRVLVLFALLAGCASAPSQFVDGTDETPLDATPPTPPGVPCATIALTADRDVLGPGEVVIFDLSVANCGRDPIPVPPFTDCAEAASPALVVDNGIERYLMAPDPRWSAPTRVTFTMSHGYCIGLSDGMPTSYVLEPGVAHRETLRWNGSVVETTLCEVEQSEQFPMGGRTNCDVVRPARPGIHRVSASFQPSLHPSLSDEEAGPLVEANVTVDVLSPPGAFIDARAVPTSDPREPLDFDPTLMVALSPDANGTLARLDVYSCEQTNGTIERCFGRQSPAECRDVAAPTERSDADRDKIFDDFQTFLANTTRAETIVSTRCGTTWSDIVALRTEIGDFPVNAIWTQVGFSADLTRAQVEALAARDDVRSIEGNKAARVEREWLGP